MKLAIIAGGWHWPGHFYHRLPAAAIGADLFVIAHRAPELPIVREEKRSILELLPRDPLGNADREMYGWIPTIRDLRAAGWHYEECPNTVGDWGFFNQWLERHPMFDTYDVILNLHDDTWIRSAEFPPIHKASDDWLLWGHSKYPEAPAGYVRGSLEFWRPELLKMLGGRIDLGDVQLTREGKTDSPAGLDALSQWNDTAVPLRTLMRQRGLLTSIRYLSPYYRVSPWFIEGERGLLSNRGGAPWSFEEGMKRWPIESR